MREMAISNEAMPGSVALTDFMAIISHIETSCF